MKRLMKFFALSGILIVVFSLLLFRAEATKAAPALTCPGWNVIPSANSTRAGNDLLAVAAISANDVWAIGTSLNKSGTVYHTLAEQWNGTTWSVVATPNPDPEADELSAAAAVSTNDVWAVGQTFPSGGMHQTLIEQWNGSQWSVVPSPNPGSTYSVLTGVTAISANNVWAVGSFSKKSNVNTLIEHWNGSAWSVISSPNTTSRFNVLQAVTTVSATDMWAVGEYAGSDPYRPLIEQWNGSNWNIVASPTSVKSANYLYSISAVSAKDIWAVGSSVPLQGNTAGLIEHWNGTKWSMSHPANPSHSYLFSGVAAIASNNVWAIGSPIEQWNGKQWSIVSSPSVGALNGVARVPGTKNLWSVGYSPAGPGMSNTLTEYYCA